MQNLKSGGSAATSPIAESSTTLHYT